MKTQLTSLRKLVLNGIQASSNPTLLRQDYPKIEPINWSAELPKIKEEMLGQIHRLLLSKKNDRLVKRHLQQTQRECITLLNYLQEEQHGPNWPNGLYPATTACLEEVLLHLYNSHQSYFDWEINAPSLQVAEAQTIIGQQMNLLKAGLKSKKVERDLIALICNSFERFMVLRICTYHQINYMKVLQQSLIKLCSKIGNLEFDDILLEHLFYYGFNESAFVCYCKNRITITIAQLYQVDEQYEKLCQFEKSLIAQQEKADCCFSSQRLSLKSQIFAFVDAELSYYQKKQAYFTQKPSLFEARREGIPHYRIKLSLSAASLAYLIRLMIENEVILNTPKTSLLDFVAKHFQTAGIGEKQLSPQSLGTKYKQVTQHTAMGLRHLLNKMIKQVDADFGKT